MSLDARQQATLTYQWIHKQPDHLRTMFARETSRIAEAAAILAKAQRVFTVGIGSSHHASLVSSWLLRHAGKDAIAVHAFDFVHYPEQFPLREGDAAVLFGHTGSSTYTKEALARLVEHGTPVVAVGSTVAEHPGAAVILCTTEPEESTTYTSSHLAAMAIVARVADALGAADIGRALDALPDQVADLLARDVEVWSVAERAADKRIYAHAAGPNEATATELMIKVREAAFHTVDGMASEQFLHGPTVSFNRADVAVIIHVSGAAQERVGAIARVNAAMGGDLWVIGQPVEGVEATVFELPEVPEVVSPLLAVVPMQLFASRLAAIRDTNPDKFRMDDPVYEAAFRTTGF
jgi:glucosamine--fructose-6-phosphate aminotransferase (isomerizing)